MKDAILSPYLIVLDYLWATWYHLKSRLKKSAPPVRWSHGASGDILLIQGWGESWTFYQQIGDSLNKLGFRLHVIRALEHNRLSIATCSHLIEKYIRTNKLHHLILLGHSKGGLIAKYFLDHSPLGKNVDKVVTIASPFLGTHLARHLDDLPEMAIGSTFLAKLNSKEQNNHKILNLYPKVDNLVIPNSHLILKGAKNIKIDIVGHARILQSPQTLNEIAHYLNS